MSTAPKATPIEDRRSPEQLRECLKLHLGEKRYREFLRNFVGVARRKGRLTYWLERALDDAGIHLTFAECLPIFTYCHVHDVPLSKRVVPVRTDVDDIRYSREFEQALAFDFPYAREFVLKAHFPGAAGTIEMDYCEECAQRFEKWRAAAAKEIEGFVLIVEDIFRLPQGTVVTGTPGSLWKSSKAGDPIELQTPNGQSIRTSIRELERFRSGSGRAILLKDELTLDQVPRGTKVLKL